MIACLVFGILLALGVPAGAQEVAEEELRSADREIQFENYSGPYERIDTAEEIKAIGFLLAGSLKQDGRTGRFLTKYTLLRALDPREQGKFDADILSIEAEARVDHIDNVRRILAGYLEGAFAYSAADARLLARFATVYNAVYRGNLGYFGTKYKAVVMSHLSARNAGISTRYYEWPGATRLLIPLTTGAAEGKLGSLSTKELTEKGVIEEMRRQPDKGLEERKDMVELKEREIEEKQAEAQEAQKELAAEKAELEKREAEAAAAATPEEKAETEAAVAAQKEEVKKAEAAVAEKKAEVAAKEAEVAEERTGIIADEKARELAGEGAGAATAGAFALADQLYFLKVRPRERSGSISGTLSILDPGPPGVKLTSPVDYVRGRAFYFFKDSILVVAQERSPGGAAYLFQLNPLTLEPIKRSAEEVYADSFVLIQGGAIYAVLKSGNDFRLGRFDENLALAARSPMSVDRDSSLALFADRVYASSASRDILALDAQDLSQQAVVK
jgi:Borrelia P83/100 protein